MLYTFYFTDCERVAWHFVSLFLQASMLTNPDGPFINLSRLNLAKYSQKPNLSRVRLRLWLAKIKQVNCFFFSCVTCHVSFPSSDTVRVHLPSWKWCEKCKWWMYLHNKGNWLALQYRIVIFFVQEMFFFLFSFPGVRFGCSSYWACSIQRLVVESSAWEMLLQASNSKT